MSTLENRKGTISSQKLSQITRHYYKGLRKTPQSSEHTLKRMIQRRGGGGALEGIPSPEVKGPDSGGAQGQAVSNRVCSGWNTESKSEKRWETSGKKATPKKMGGPPAQRAGC